MDLNTPFEARALRSARKALGAITEEWGFSDQARREIELSFSEALQNAVEHGCSGKGIVHVTGRVNLSRVQIVIEDRGAGKGNLEALKAAFESGEEVLPKLDKERGRGIYLIRNLMDQARVEYPEEGGVRVIMIKNRS